MDEDGSAESGRTRLARGTLPHTSLGEPERTDGASADAAVALRGGDDARVRSALLTAPARASSLPASPGAARRAVRATEAPEPGRAGSAPTDMGMTASGPASAVERSAMRGDPDGSASGPGSHAARQIERSQTSRGPESSTGAPESNALRGIARSEIGGRSLEGSTGTAGSNAQRGIAQSEMEGGNADSSAGAAGSNAPRGIERSAMSADRDGSGGPRDCAPRGIDARGSGPVPVGGAPGRAAAQSICEAVEQLIEAQEADDAIAEWMQGGG